jgi:LmbE family N-acetylglucosaminyl deacetylase
MLRVADFWGAQRVLVLAPHADDETFGCGGLIAKVKASGGEAYVIVASVGDLNHYGVGADLLPELAGVAAGSPPEIQSSPQHSIDPSDRATQVLVPGAVRAAELARAMATLQVDGYEILFTDSDLHLRLDTLPIRDLIALVEREARYAIDNIAPTVLVLPACTYNQDHEALFKAGMAACRPHLPDHRPFVPIVLTCDAPQLGWHHQPFQPDLYVDISTHLETKLRAHACHRSQLKTPPHHASLENVERLARLRGAEVSVEAAEAFRCLRILM